jgi:hypothetical protein
MVVVVEVGEDNKVGGDLRVGAIDTSGTVLPSIGGCED